MNGTPRLNQERLPALGIEPRSLDHKPQPLTIETIPEAMCTLLNLLKKLVMNIMHLDLIYF